MKKRILACFLALVLPMGLFVGCSETLPAVYVQSVAELIGYGSTGAFNTCAGVVMAQDEVNITRDETREIKGLSVELGQYVNEGDVLFIYDTSDIELDIDRMELEIEQMQNSITDMNNQITQLEKEKKTAASDDKLAYTLQIQSLENDLKEAKYNLEVMKRDLEDLKKNRDNGEVYAPISGEVTALNRNGGYDSFTGELLPYITLMRNDVYQIKGTVNELNRDEFYVGQSVIIRSRVDAAQYWTGVITQIDMDAEVGNDYFYYDEMYSSNSYPFYVTPDENGGLILGQHVFIEPDCGQTALSNGLFLDASYVCGDADEGYYVWAADEEDKLEKRKIEIAGFDGALNSYQITGGLSTSDRVAFPEEGLQAGAPVTDVLAQTQAPETEPETTVSETEEQDLEPETLYTGDEAIEPELPEDGGSV